MSLGLRESRSHERRRRRLRLLKWLFVLGCLTAGGATLYKAGAMLAQGEVQQLRNETQKLSETIAEVRKRNLDLMALTERSKLDAREWQRRYKQDVPQGAAKTLYALVADQLAAGVTVDRLAFVINSVDRGQACDNAPVTKRFLVKTPVSGSSNRSVTFANNAITVIGEGQSSTNTTNQPEAWFDPAKPVTVLFSRLGGKTSQVMGTLPLHHSIVLGDHEYRFTITASDTRGFVNVAGDRCKFP